MGIETIWVIITILVSALGGVGIVIRQRNSELANLVDTRGQYIHDLEDKISRLETRIGKLEGQYEALQSFKVQEIAEQTAYLVAKKLGIED